MDIYEDLARKATLNQHVENDLAETKEQLQMLRTDNEVL